MRMAQSISAVINVAIVKHAKTVKNLDVVKREGWMVKLTSAFWIILIVILFALATKQARIENDTECRDTVIEDTETNL